MDLPSFPLDRVARVLLPKRPVERKIIDKSSSNNKGWKKYFQVSTSEFYKTEPESDVILPIVYSPKLRGKVYLFLFDFLVLLLFGY